MAEPPRQEERSRQQYRERPAERKAERPVERDAVSVSEALIEQSAIKTKQKPAVQLGELKVTPGRNGERNIHVEWIAVPVGIHSSARFNVKTASGDELEVTIAQQEYRKSLSGQGSVVTTVVPVAPIGTTGKVVSQDNTTGEIVEQPWTWALLGRWSIWGTIKKILGLD